MRAIVADPAHGPDALSSAQAMANLLQDLLPDAPREAGILAAAAQRDVAGMLRTHIEQGVDPAIAVRLAAAAFAARTAFPVAACEWSARELAVALGLLDQASTPVRDLGQPGDSVQASPPVPEPQPVHGELTAPARQNTIPVAGGTGATAVTPGAGNPAPAGPVRRTRTTLIGAAAAFALLAAAAVGYEIAGSARPAAGSPPTAPPATTPAPGGTASSSRPPPPRPAARPRWIAQLASVKIAAGPARLDAVLAKVRRSVPQAQVLNSSSFASLRPGYWVVYFPGPFTDGVQALAYCASHGLTTSNQCIGRYLSDNPVDFSYQCYPPAASPAGSCYHPAAAPTTQSADWRSVRAVMPASFLVVV